MGERELPEGWEWKRLGDIGQYINGKAFKPSDWTTSGKPIVRIQNLTSEESNYNFFQGECEERYLIKNGDILISWSASLDVFVWNGWDAVLNQHIFKAIPNEKIIDRKFLVYIVGSILEGMKKYSHGSTMKHIVKGDFDNSKIPLPPLPVQRHIVAVFEQADAVKRQRQEADALTGALLQSVFFDMFGDPVRDERGWEVMELEKLSSHIIDCPHSTPECEEIITPYPCIRTTELKDGYIDWTKMKYLNEKNYVERIRRLTPEEGDLVFGREGSFGVAVRVPKNVKICLGQRVMLFRPDRKYCNSEFLWALLNSDAIVRQANSKTSGSTVAHINVTDIKKFDGISPPLALQHQFARIVEEVERIREQQVASGRQIEGLMQRAFAGQLAV